MSQIEPEVLQDIPIVKASEVIRKRQLELVGKSIELDQQINELEKQRKQIESTLKTLKTQKAEVQMEYDILEKFDDRSMIKVTSNTTTTTTTTIEYEGRKKSADRMNFEDALSSIMQEAGRPLQFTDIRNRLESFGFKWMHYNSAHAYITRNSGLLEQVGKRGFYQLLR